MSLHSMVEEMFGAFDIYWPKVPKPTFLDKALDLVGIRLIKKERTPKLEEHVVEWLKKNLGFFKLQSRIGDVERKVNGLIEKDRDKRIKTIEKRKNDIQELHTYIERDLITRFDDRFRLFDMRLTELEKKK